MAPSGHCCADRVRNAIVEEKPQSRALSAHAALPAIWLRIASISEADRVG